MHETFMKRIFSKYSSLTGMLISRQSFDNLKYFLNLSTFFPNLFRKENSTEIYAIYFIFVQQAFFFFLQQSCMHRNFLSLSLLSLSFSFFTSSSLLLLSRSPSLSPHSLSHTVHRRTGEVLSELLSPADKNKIGRAHV